MPGVLVEPTVWRPVDVPQHHFGSQIFNLRWVFQCIFFFATLPVAEKHALQCTLNQVANLKLSAMISPQLIVPVCHQWPCDGIATSTHKPNTRKIAKDIDLAWGDNQKRLAGLWAGVRKWTCIQAKRPGAVSVFFFLRYHAKCGCPFCVLLLCGKCFYEIKCINYHDHRWVLYCSTFWISLGAHFFEQMDPTPEGSNGAMS